MAVFNDLEMGQMRKDISQTENAKVCKVSLGEHFPPSKRGERERVAKRDKEWGNDGGDATNPSLHSVVPPSLF